MSKNPEGEGPVGRLNLDGRIIFKQMLLDGSLQICSKLVAMAGGSLTLGS